MFKCRVIQQIYRNPDYFKVFENIDKSEMGR